MDDAIIAGPEGNASDTVVLVVDEAPSVAEVKAATAGLFRRSVWRGHINYECELCPYATLDALVMAGHLRSVHGIQTANTATGANTPAEPIILIEENEVK